MASDKSLGTHNQVARASAALASARCSSRIPSAAAAGVALDAAGLHLAGSSSCTGPSAPPSPTASISSTTSSRRLLLQPAWSKSTKWKASDPSDADTLFQTMRKLQSSKPGTAAASRRPGVMTAAAGTAASVRPAAVGNRQHISLRSSANHLTKPSVAASSRLPSSSSTSTMSLRGPAAAAPAPASKQSSSKPAVAAAAAPPSKHSSSNPTTTAAAAGGSGKTTKRRLDFDADAQAPPSCVAGSAPGLPGTRQAAPAAATTTPGASTASSCSSASAPASTAGDPTGAAAANTLAPQHPAGPPQDLQGYSKVSKSPQASSSDISQPPKVAAMASSSSSSSGGPTGASGAAGTGLPAPAVASKASTKSAVPPLPRRPLFKTTPLIAVVLQLALGCTAAGCLMLSLVVVLCLLLVMTCISDDSGLLFAVLQDVLLA